MLLSDCQLHWCTWPFTHSVLQYFYRHYPRYNNYIPVLTEAVRIVESYIHWLSGILLALHSYKFSVALKVRNRKGILRNLSPLFVVNSLG